MMTDNPRYPHKCTITRQRETDAMFDESESVVIYDGECRSFSKTTVSDSGEVITSLRVLSIPTLQSEWTEDTVPREGDIVHVDKGSFTEDGIVVDKEPTNLGTHVLWRDDKN